MNKGTIYTLPVFTGHVGNKHCTIFCMAHIDGPCSGHL